jgi:glutamate-1-semialdehyde 2,1-aminomutase
MKPYREELPSDICFARGTFYSHPYVMAAMNEFLRRIEQPELQQLYAGLDETWQRRARQLNARLAAAELPVQVANLSSIFTVLYTRPSRYNWMLQFYLQAEGLMLSWVGSGRLIFSLNYTEQDFNEVTERFVRAAARMHAEGWWWQSPQLSNRAIQRQILGELLHSRCGRPRPTRSLTQARS